MHNANCRIPSVLLLIITVVFSAKGQQTITLKPGPTDGTDVMLRSDLPNENHEHTGDFAAWYWTFNGLVGEGRGLLKFDLSAVPQNAVVSDARLSLYYNNISNSSGHAGNNASYLKPITQPWNPATVTWNTRPATSSSGAITLASSVISDQNYPDIDVTNLVNTALANPAAYYGWEISLVNPLLYKSMLFASSDNSNPALWPELEITYSTPAGSPGTMQTAVWQLAVLPTSVIAAKSGSQANLAFSLFSAGGRLVSSGTFVSGAAITTEACAPHGMYVLYFEDNGTPVTLKFLKP